VRGTDVLRNRPFWTTSPGRSLVPSYGTPTWIAVGGAGMIRQRHAAVP
jgi:hypothetical protein